MVLHHATSSVKGYCAFTKATAKAIHCYCACTETALRALYMHYSCEVRELCAMAK